MPILIIIGLAIVAIIGLQVFKTRAPELTTVANGQTAQPAAELTVGSQVQDLEFTRSEGGGKLKLSELKSKVIMVNFWATWCEACMVEMPSIVKLRDLYHDRGFEVAAINLDENPDVVLAKTMRELKMDFPVYLDPESKIADLFDVHAIPFTIILDSQRKVLMIETGERDWNGEDIHSQLEKWLSG